ncbi:MAG: hypothetical protein ABI886_08945 [Betaproteobacteria bacterium]
MLHVMQWVFRSRIEMTGAGEIGTVRAEPTAGCEVRGLAGGVIARVANLRTRKWLIYVNPANFNWNRGN